MEKTDLLKPGDEVKVIIYGPDGSELYKMSGNGFHNLEGAINETLEKANLDIDPEDCYFEVSNETKGVSHRYRINAHGNLKLIV